MNYENGRRTATMALSEVSFQAAPGEVQALIGENGVGKSALMKIFSGVIAADFAGWQRKLIRVAAGF